MGPALGLSMRKVTVLCLLLVSSLALAQKGAEQNLGTFKGKLHMTDRYQGRRGAPKTFKTTEAISVTVTRLPGNLLRIKKGPQAQTFQIIREGSPSQGVQEIEFARPTTGPIAQQNLDALNPHWSVRWLAGGYKSMASTGMVTLYEGQGLVFEQQGSGRVRLGPTRAKDFTWDETFTGEK